MTEPSSPPAAMGEAMGGTMAALPRRFAAPVDLGDRRLRPLILRLALPSVVGLSINALHQAVNAVFLGMVDGAALAAVTLVLPLLMVVGALGEGLGVGVAAAIGRLLGEKRLGSASVAASTAMLATLPLGLAATALLWIFGEPLLRLFGATPEALPLASLYLSIMALGATTMLLQVVCDFVAISEGNTRFSMGTLIAVFGLNIVLDPILIFWLDLGVAGAALATLMSQGLALAAYAVYFARRWGKVRVRPSLVRFGRRLVPGIVSVGLPTTLASIVTGFAYALVYRAAAEHGGAEAIAGIGIALRLLAFGTLPIIGFALGAQGVLSFAWGARDLQRLDAALSFMLAVGTAVGLVYAGTMVIFAPVLAGLFTEDPVVRRFAVGAIILVHLPFPLTGARFVALVLVQAMQRPRLAAMISLAPQGYLLIPALAILPPWLGYGGVGAGLAVAAGLTGVAALALLAKLRGELRQPTASARASQSASTGLGLP